LFNEKFIVRRVPEGDFMTDVGAFGVVGELEVALPLLALALLLTTTCNGVFALICPPFFVAYFPGP
jgi:hypothetical protein